MSETTGFVAHERRFPSAAAATSALAADITAALQNGLAAGRGASLVVPGGHSPVALFEELSNADLDWEDVWVTLGDERWVDPHDSASNERLVREHLLRNAAARANFVGLKNSAADPHAGAAPAWSALAELPRPFDYTVLGMGDDGHTASLFPQSPRDSLQRSIASAPPGCIAMQAPQPPRLRLSLNLRALLDSRRIALLIIGEAKWATYQRARLRGPIEEMPVRALFHQQNVPVSVYWGP